MYPLYRSKRTQITMLQDRGYQIPEDDEVIMHLTLNGFITSYVQAQGLGTVYQRLSHYYERAQPPDVVFVIYLEPSKEGKQVGVAQIREVTGIIPETIRHVILISETSLSYKARGYLNEMTFITFETFTYDELGYNPTKHVLVPKHSVLSPEEARAFLAENKLRFSQLPFLSRYDPIARYYGMKVGDIVRITRPILYETSIVSSEVAHRGVVDVPLERTSARKTG